MKEKPMAYESYLRKLNRSLQPGERLIYMEYDRFRLSLMQHPRRVKAYPASAGARGLGERGGSQATPRGLHRIAAKIGARAPTGTVFESRRPTGEILGQYDTPRKNLILSRIIRLEGLENGFNRGGDVDSYRRFIYIHGTNRENAVGTNHFSHGCIVMKNNDIIDLFDRVEEGDYVLIA
ncbi:MAG: L,D-transpeptidase [Fibrobacterota bacterium]